MNNLKVRLAAAAAAFVLAAGSLASPVPAKNSSDSKKEQERQTMNSVWLLPDADKHYIAESDISWMTDTELLLARNEFYARRGRKFDTKFIKKYFKSQAWYKGKIKPANFSPYTFNKYEQANIDYILIYERMRAALREQKKKNKGKATDVIVTGPSSDGLGKYGEVVKLYSGTVEPESSAGLTANALAEQLEDPAKPGYCFADLNGDGEQEMLVGPTDAHVYGEGAVFSIYSIVDDKVTEVASSSSDSVYYLCSDGSVRREQSFENGSWQVNYYRLMDGQLVCTNILRMDEERDPDSPWFAASAVSGLGGILIDRDEEGEDDLSKGLDSLPDGFADPESSVLMEEIDVSETSYAQQTDPASGETEMDRPEADPAGSGDGVLYGISFAAPEGEVSVDSLGAISTEEALALRASYASDVVEYMPFE